MRPPAPILVRSSHWSALGSITAVAVLLACHDPDGPGRLPTEPASGAPVALKPVRFASHVVLPTLGGRSSEALAVNSAGTVVVGFSYEQGNAGTIRAVRWTLGQDGSWTIAALPHAAGATGATGQGVDDQGDAAGNDFPGATSDAVLWPAGGGFSVLSCAGETGAATVYGISADGQAVVGYRALIQPATAGVWRPGGCREDLPPLAVGAGAVARAANGDGTIVGGFAGLTSSGDVFPVRWTRVAGQWQVEQLDQRPGLMRGANAAGDLAGQVEVSCSAPEGCQRAIIWYAAGGSRELGTLGGNDSWARDINAAGEVVGASTTSRGAAGYFWSDATGMRQLPSSGSANAVSGIRTDGSRLVVGIDQRVPRAAVWVVRPEAGP